MFDAIIDVDRNAVVDAIIDIELNGILTPI
jgi:hypothetical protein